MVTSLVSLADPRDMNTNEMGLFYLFGKVDNITGISTLYFHLIKVWGATTAISVLEAIILFLMESIFPYNPILRVAFFFLVFFFSFLLFFVSSTAYSRRHDPLSVRALFTLPLFVGPIFGIFLLLHIRRVREDAFNVHFAQ